jgi:DNA end-binding protein Ku
MVRTLIKRKTEDWKPDLLTDPVQKNLQSMIAAKKKKINTPTKPKSAATAPAAGGNVINIMDALRKSLANEKKQH